MSSRRGFLRGILALAAAPVIVRADSLMRVIAVDTTIILPSTFDIAFNDLTPNTDYIHSMYIKRRGGEWERLVTYFNSGSEGKTTLGIPMNKDKEVFVWGNQIESSSHRGGGITPNVKLVNSSIIVGASPTDKGEKVGMSQHTFKPGFSGKQVTTPYMQTSSFKNNSWDLKRI